MIFDKVRIYSIYEYWSQWCRRGSVTAPTLPEKMVPARYCRYGVNSTWYIPTSTWYLVPGTLLVTFNDDARSCVVSKRMMDIK